MLLPKRRINGAALLQRNEMWQSGQRLPVKSNLHSDSEETKKKVNDYVVQMENVNCSAKLNKVWKTSCTISCNLIYCSLNRRQDNDWESSKSEIHWCAHPEQALCSNGEPSKMLNLSKALQ